MSSGVFQTAYYSSNELESVHPIRVQPETLALTLGGEANDTLPSTGAIGPSAQVGRGKRALGINARTVTVVLTAALSGYKAGSPITLPWLDDATYSAIIPKVTTGTYLGTACKVTGKSPEKVN